MTEETMRFQTANRDYAPLNEAAELRASNERLTSRNAALERRIARIVELGADVDDRNPLVDDLVAIATGRE